MGKLIHAEESIFDYLKKLTTSNSFSTGLILGQSSQQKDHVVLLSKTPDQNEDENKGEPPSEPLKINSVKQIQEAWVADHAKHVTKMLPGGFWVLGIFVCSSTDVFGDSLSQSKLKSILHNLKKLLSSDSLLHANSPTSEKIILYFNPVDNSYVCKSLDVNTINSTFKSCEWKFQNNLNKWLRVSCNFNLFRPSLGGNTSSPLKTQLKHVLNQVNMNINEALVTFEGQLKNDNDSLASLLDKNRKSEYDHSSSEEKFSIKASIYVPFEEGTQVEDIVFKDCNVELHLLGSVASQVFLNDKATIFEAVNAVKQDIIRSLAARLEMHWDSLVEEEYGSPEEKQTIHEPPRRVSVLLPANKIAFNDYLFPGEGPSEVVSSFKELLDVAISEGGVQELEIQGDPTEFFEKSMSIDSTSSDDMLRPTLPMGLWMLAYACAVLLIGVAIGLHMLKSA